ncbi:MAG: glycosyltransferase family 4 protein, partial [Lachnospiraceae bacterium]|nr:glycosyltransferase family 4 protein [Lachnospiraceae bacterium]
MNILVIHCRYRIFGGEDRVVADDAALLRKMGHNVITYTLSNEVLNEMGIAARIRSVIDYLHPVKQRRGIIRMIKKHSADVIWVHNTLWMYGTAPYEAGRICGVPVIQTVHNYRLLCPNGICYRKGSICRDCIGKFPKGLHNAIFRRCYRNSAVLTAAIALNIKKQQKALRNNIRIVCVSEHQRKLLLGSVKGLNPKEVYIKRNSINAAHPFRPYGERGNRFLYAGRLTESKGIKELLTAWKSIEMKMNGDAPGLVICGAGELSEYIDRYISENRLRHVINQGELPKERVHALMAD